MKYILQNRLAANNNHGTAKLLVSSFVNFLSTVANINAFHLHKNTQEAISLIVGFHDSLLKTSTPFMNQSGLIMIKHNLTYGRLALLKMYNTKIL